MPAVRDRASAPPTVLPTSEARRSLPKTSREFKERGVNAEPVFFGAHREPAGVMLSYERYLKMLDLLDDLAIALRIRQRDHVDEGARLTLDELIREHGLERSDIE